MNHNDICLMMGDVADNSDASADESVTSTDSDVVVCSCVSALSSTSVGQFVA